MKSRIRLWTSQAGDPPDEESGHELLLSEAKPSLTAHSFQFSSGSAGCHGGALSFVTFLWASKVKYIPNMIIKKDLPASCQQVFYSWELLDSNQRPPACKAGALNQLS